MVPSSMLTPSQYPGAVQKTNLGFSFHCGKDKGCSPYRWSRFCQPPFC